MLAHVYLGSFQIVEVFVCLFFIKDAYLLHFLMAFFVVLSCPFHPILHLASNESLHLRFMPSSNNTFYPFLLTLTYCHFPIFAEDSSSWLIIFLTTQILELSSMTSTSMELFHPKFYLRHLQVPGRSYPLPCYYTNSLAHLNSCHPKMFHF